MLIWFEKYKQMIVIVIIAVIILLLFVFKFQQKEEALTEPIWTESELESEQVEKEMQDVKSTPENIFIDVKGAVQKPGLYEAVEGERVDDVVEKAGGLLKTADEKQINFAMKLSDEMVIYIPEIGEVEMEMPHVDTMSSSNDEKVNINQADATELETISGIGPSKAATIIQYREENGLFKEIEELMNISGIGEKTFEKLKEQITIQ
ncbi:competence protein ComEA [Bacillus sp. J14TS2]|uniref:helix-hairpin-helix domain-containing protein n=1 Tax=Bacillus sp. J14TS2 TaxID=2807188 RepID=UPI001B2D8F5F|nr:helix-hairpin-helix domain-containing protein [Bacillus sp. J14TS2]GIN70999.1 competence protein ComEA [Bacillus sp. J14TS2]